MKRRSFFLAIVGILLVATLVFAPVSIAKDYKWKIGQPMPEGTFLFDATKELVKDISEATKGRITVTHYPGDLLGDVTLQNKNVMTGTQEMAISWPSPAENPKWVFMTVPFIFRTYKEAQTAYAPGGWWMKTAEPIATACKWKLLGSVPLGFTGFVAREKWDSMPIEKKYKIRVMADEGAKKTVDAMGFNSVTMSWGEIHSSLALGTVDGAWGPTASDDFKMFLDVAKYGYLYRSNFSITPFFMNLDLFKSLSPEDQAILEKTTADWTVKMWNMYADYENKQFEEMSKAGKLITLTAKEWSANAEKVRKEVWPFYEAILGQDIFKLIRQNAVKLPVEKGTDEPY